MWNLVRIGSMASEEMSFENVDGRRPTDRRRMPAYTISSPMSLWLRWAKIRSESFDFALSLLLTHVVCMETYIIMFDHQWFTYKSDMLQIFDNDYVTLTSFSRSFKYIFSKLDSDHTSSSAYWISFPPTPLTQLPADTYCVNRQYKFVV